jgi:hypothetical protein
MSAAQEPTALESRLVAVFESGDEDLLSLARLGGLDPAEDFQGADLRRLDLHGEDLSAFDFRGADLRECDLRDARIRRDAVAGAWLEGARLEGTRWLGGRRDLLFGGVGNWRELNGPEQMEFLGQVSPIDGRYHANSETTRVLQRGLPFYDDVLLFAVYDESWSRKPLIVYYLSDRGNLFRLNGTSPPIHEVNAKAPVRIREDNVLDYLRFFSFFVRGDEGPFYIAESIDDPRLPMEMNAATRSVVESTIRPASLEGMDANGNYLCDAIIFYSNALFVGNFAIQHTGMVEMTNDEPLAGDLTVRVELPVV